MKNFDDKMKCDMRAEGGVGKKGPERGSHIGLFF